MRRQARTARTREQRAIRRFGGPRRAHGWTLDVLLIGTGFERRYRESDRSLRRRYRASARPISVEVVSARRGTPSGDGRRMSIVVTLETP